MPREDIDRLKGSFAVLLRSQAEEAVDLAREAHDDPDLLDAVGDILERLAHTARSLDLLPVLQAAELAARAVRSGTLVEAPLVALLDQCRALDAVERTLRSILIVAPVDDIVRTQAIALGAPVEFVETAIEALRRAHAGAPAALVIPEQDLDACRADVLTDVPVWAYGAGADLAMRIRAVRFGAVGYLPTPLDLRDALPRIRHRLAGTPSGPHKILLVDPAGETAFAQRLRASDVEVDVLADSRLLLARLDDTTPEAALLVMSPRGVRAEHLLAVIRGHHRYGDLPIALLAFDGGSELEALKTDADAVLRRDIDPALFRARFRALLDRGRRERGVRAQEVPSGVMSRGAFLRAADREIALTRRSRLPLTVARVDLDARMRGPVADLALKHIARALSADLRGTDIVGLLGESGYGVLMPSCTAESARSRLGPILARTTIPDQPSPLFGVADTTSTVEDVLVRADRELMAARRRT